MSLPNYLRAFRKSGAFSQAELAHLLRLTQSSILEAELYRKAPSASILVGSAIIFDRNAREIFPKAYEDMEVRILRQAKLLYERLEATDGLSAKTKLQLLAALIKRLTDNHDV